MGHKQEKIEHKLPKYVKTKQNTGHKQ
jgi:hypothetical protein